MPTIDADAHVIECEQTWSYIENEKIRPVLDLARSGAAAELVGRRAGV